MSSTRTMVIVSCEEFRSGTSDSGRDWTIYDVAATDPDGNPIDKKLKSFEYLEGTVEVEVEKNSNPKYDEYMLRRPGGGGGGGGGGGMASLRARIEQLEARVTSLEAPKSDIPSGVTASPTASTPDPDDDIPF
jgi:hypothetical protein